MAGAATETLGGEAFVPKGGPRAKVFAALAPLDLEVGFVKDPHGNIAGRAEPLVLAWDNVMGVFRIRVVLAVVWWINDVLRLFGSTEGAGAETRGRGGTDSELPAHDAVTLAIVGIVGSRSIVAVRAGLVQVVGVVHKTMKVRDRGVLDLVNLTVCEGEEDKAGKERLK